MSAKLGQRLRASLVRQLLPCTISLVLAFTYYRRRKSFMTKLKQSESSRSFADLQTAAKAKKKKSSPFDQSFLKDMVPLLKIAFGKREIANIGLLTGTLLLRTMMTLWLAKSMGRSMEAFCKQQWRKLGRGTQEFAAWTMLAACINGFLKYFQNLLSTNVRRRLTLASHTLYMKNMNYYKANKVGDGKFENCDQLIADDIAKFSHDVADVYSNSLKPLVDFVMFSVDMYRNMGWEGPVGMYSWFAISAGISTAILPSYGRLYAEEQVLEGRFRAAHAELIQNGEMIAFFRGETPEKRVLDKAFQRIRRHVLSVAEMKLPSDIVQGYVNKYLASVVGSLLIFYPVCYNVNGLGSLDAGQVAKYFISNRQVMEGLATSVLAFFELQKKVGNIRGLASRLSVLFRGLTQKRPILEDEIEEHKDTNPPRFVVGDTLKFEKVSVFRPDGALLIKDLDMEVKAGDSVMITGDNGCGKSSLFRVLCHLWPLVCGTITKPDPKLIFFLSQVNFVPLGTLRDLVIYPHSTADMVAEGKSDENVLQALSWAHLGDLQCDNTRPGLNDTLTWGTALSPGQKQRMAFARLLYHRPKYAVLDECTNGISPDVEADLYQRCHTLGMAIFSISHKVELKKLHDRELHILADGKGGYRLFPLKDGQPA